VYLHSECEESIQSSIIVLVYFGESTSTENINAAVTALSCYLPETASFLKVM
jgi:hypothetical protein